MDQELPTGDVSGMRCGSFRLSHPTGLISKRLLSIVLQHRPGKRGPPFPVDAAIRTNACERQVRPRPRRSEQRAKTRKASEIRI